MDWVKRRLQIFGSSFVGLLLIVGFYLLYNDLFSLISQQRQVLENFAFTVAHSVSSNLVESALATKDSQTPSDSQLLDQLNQLRTDLHISGNLYVLDPRETRFRVMSSTKPGVKKEDPFTVPEEQKAGALTDKASTSLYSRDSSYWITAFAALKNPEGKTIGVVAVESDESAFIYKLLGYGLHYLLLAIGLITIGGFLFLWSSAKATRSLESAQNRYFTLFRETSDGILFLDLRGNILKANDSALQIFQENIDRMVGRNLLTGREAQFTFIPLDTNKDILKNTIGLGEKFKSKAKLVLKNDKIKYLAYSSFPLSEFRKVVGAIVILQDVTQDVVREQELVHYQSQLKEENKELQQQVITDPLTHCLNTQYLQHFLDWNNLKWIGFEGCSIIMIDIDNFKHINDTKGHLAGDNVLQSFAAFLKGFFRRADKIIRYGGDEFVVLLPQTNLESAQRIANNCLKAMAEKGSDAFEGITVSMGVAELQPNEQGKDWLVRADRALYEAKRAGKNSVYANDPNQLEILN